MDRLSAPGYDLFKLIVALILTLLLAILLLRGCNQVPPVPVAEMDTPGQEVVNVVSPAPATEEPPQEPTLEPTEEPTEEPPPTPSVTASPEEPPAAITDTPAPPPVTDTPTPAPVTDTPAPAPVTDTPTPAPVTDTPTPEPVPGTACNTSMPSRLSAGQRARTLVNLNLRTGPDIKAPIIQTNRSGTQVEIIGGPECNLQGERAYLWWQIRLVNGTEGWSAETPLIQKSYFLEALP